jgi:hypothetical protein
VCGPHAQDINIWLPNLFGTVLGVVQLGLRYAYGARPSAGDAGPSDAAQLARADAEANGDSGGPLAPRLAASVKLEDRWEGPAGCTATSARRTARARARVRPAEQGVGKAEQSGGCDGRPVLIVSVASVALGPQLSRGLAGLIRAGFLRGSALRERRHAVRAIRAHRQRGFARRVLSRCVVRAFAGCGQMIGRGAMRACLIRESKTRVPSVQRQACCTRAPAPTRMPVRPTHHTSRPARAPAPPAWQPARRPLGAARPSDSRSRRP